MTGRRVFVQTSLVIYAPPIFRPPSGCGILDYSLCKLEIYNFFTISKSLPKCMIPPPFFTFGWIDLPCLTSSHLISQISSNADRDCFVRIARRCWVSACFSHKRVVCGSLLPVCFLSWVSKLSLTFDCFTMSDMCYFDIFLKSNETRHW